jgi:hypothetical protein
MVVGAGVAQGRKGALDVVRSCENLPMLLEEVGIQDVTLKKGVGERHIRDSVLMPVEGSIPPGSDVSELE